MSVQQTTATLHDGGHSWRQLPGWDVPKCAFCGMWQDAPGRPLLCPIGSAEVTFDPERRHAE